MAGQTDYTSKEFSEKPARKASAPGFMVKSIRSCSIACRTIRKNLERVAGQVGRGPEAAPWTSPETGCRVSRSRMRNCRVAVRHGRSRRGGPWARRHPRVASQRPKARKSNWPTIPSISRSRISSSSTGFHMREYDYRSLRDLFLRTGFSRVRFPLVIRGFRLATPPYPVLRGIELALQAAPARLRRARLAGIVMGLTALATKQRPQANR